MKLHGRTCRESVRHFESEQPFGAVNVRPAGARRLHSSYSWLQLAVGFMWLANNYTDTSYIYIHIYIYIYIWQKRARGRPKNNWMEGIRKAMNERNLNEGQWEDKKQWSLGVIYIYIYRFQNVFLRCPTPRLHCFLSSHWPSFRFLSFVAFLIPSIQFFCGLPHALFCFGIHFNAILGNLPSTILWTWPYHVSWFCSISFIIVSSSPICCLIVHF